MFTKGKFSSQKNPQKYKNFRFYVQYKIYYFHIQYYSM